MNFDAQGVFMLVCCYYWLRNRDITVDYLEAKVSTCLPLLRLLEAKKVLLIDDDNRVHIDFLDEQFDERDELSKVRSDAGRRGGQAKGKQTQAKSSRLDKIRLDKSIISIDEPTSKSSKAKALNKKFVAPNLEQWTAYFLENGFSKELAARSWKGYNEAQWKDSLGKQILNWKSKALHVWFRDDNKSRGQTQSTKIIPTDKEYKIQD
jgi:hypothetical protein